MSIVVTAPAGHVGSQLVKRLLDAGEKPTLLARHPEKVAAFAARGAKVRQGSLADAAFVLEATRGATVLFWLTPPNPTAENLRRYQNELGRIGAEAVRVNRIPRVVNLSSVGAHLGEGVGPVNGLHDVEKIFDKVAANVTHLRPGVFMENLLFSLPSIQSAGAIHVPVSGRTQLEMIATQDVGAVAAEQVLDGSWTGKRTVTFFGPRRLDYEETAAIISQAVGRAVQIVSVPPDAARAAMAQMGLSADVAGNYVELSLAFESGLIWNGPQAAPDRRTPTTLEDFARAVIRPALAA